MNATIEDRLARLERECRRWRAGGLVALGVGVVAVGLAAVPNDPDVIRAGRIEVVDARGKGRVVIQATKDLTGLTVLDANGLDARATLGLTPGGADLLHFFPKGETAPGLSVGIEKDGAPVVTMYGPDKQMIALDAGEKMGPAVYVRDAGGNATFLARPPR